MELAVIGGGAAGMMAAITAARGGVKVQILEHKDRIGKKLLVTGNGKCNFTNALQTPECYRGEEPAFAWKVLSQFPMEATLAFFEELGILPTEKNGYYYPSSGTATAVLEVLRMELARLEVTILTGVHVTYIEKKEDAFLIHTDKHSISAEKIILATGGCAAKVHGSDGSGFLIAEKLGHRIIEPVPALTGISLEGNFTKAWQGVRVQGKVLLETTGKDKACLAEEQGELQLVDYGISGIPIFQLSRFGAKALQRKEPLGVVIDFLPTISKKDCFALLRTRIQRYPERNLEQQLIGIFHKKLSGVLLKKAHLPPNLPSNEVSAEQLFKLAGKIKEMKVKVTAVNGFDKAQVCAGGVATGEINQDTLESRMVKGIYFAGEILDIDGTCGGYNLQWAWSSGYVAGKHAAKS